MASPIERRSRCRYALVIPARSSPDNGLATGYGCHQCRSRRFLLLQSNCRRRAMTCRERATQARSAPSRMLCDELAWRWTRLARGVEDTHDLGEKPASSWSAKNVGRGGDAYRGYGSVASSWARKRGDTSYRLRGNSRPGHLPEILDVSYHAIAKSIEL